jgi:hypothetical protein
MTPYGDYAQLLKTLCLKGSVVGPTELESVTSTVLWRLSLTAWLCVALRYFLTWPSASSKSSHFPIRFSLTLLTFRAPAAGSMRCRARDSLLAVCRNWNFATGASIALRDGLPALSVSNWAATGFCPRVLRFCPGSSANCWKTRRMVLWLRPVLRAIAGQLRPSLRSLAISRASTCFRGLAISPPGSLIPVLIRAYFGHPCLPRACSFSCNCRVSPGTDSPRFREGLRLCRHPGCGERWITQTEIRPARGFEFCRLIATSSVGIEALDHLYLL